MQITLCRHVAAWVLAIQSYGGTSVLVLSIAGAVDTTAQLDDLADASWAAPQIEVLQQLADEPLCLQCVTPAQLTAIPGFNRTTASRIVRAAKSYPHSLEDIANYACLSTDQRILLLMCVSVDCSCDTSSVDARMRLRTKTTNAAAADEYARGNVRTPYGGCGAVVHRADNNTSVGGWLTIETEYFALNLGDVAVSSGMGLVNGTGSTFGRSVGAQLSTIEIMPRLRPWTSSYQNGLQRGVSITVPNLAGTPFSCLASWSKRSVSNRLETAISSAFAAQYPNHQIVANIQSLWYDTTSASTSMRIMPLTHRAMFSISTKHELSDYTITSEAALDDSINLGCAFVVERAFDKGKMLAAYRWSSPQLRNPYAAPIGSTSSLGNETGICFALQWRPTTRISLDASLDIYATLSRAFGSPLPKQGLDLTLDAESRMWRTTSIQFRLRYESGSDGWRADASAWTRMMYRERFTIRADVTIKASRQLRLRWRMDNRLACYSTRQPDAYGCLSFLDVEWKPTELWRFTLRATAFTSSSFDVAPYAFEVLMSGLSQTIVGNGSGSRLSMGVRYTPVEWCTAGIVLWQSVKLFEPSQKGVGMQADIRL